MATWTALLASWANKALSVTRLDQLLGSGGNLDYLLLRTQRMIALTGGTLTIASGVITVAPVNGYGHYKVATQGAAAADDLDTISGGTDGDVIILEMATAGQVPTLKNGTGNILLSEDVALDTLTTVIMLRLDGTNWKMVASPASTFVAWPVGSVFVAVVSTNPATLLGYGTWVAFGAGRVLVGLDAGQTEFDTVEETGGAKTHTLSTDEIPAHTHDIDATAAGFDAGSGGDWQPGGAGSYNTGATGGGGAHNNLQPYIVVYMWKRTG